MCAVQVLLDMFSLATKGDVPKISQPCLNRGIGYDSIEQSGVETSRLNRGEYDVELSAVNETVRYFSEDASVKIRSDR